jgi:dTDP-4-dehydrorhamnose 3,5-epimerase
VSEAAGVSILQGERMIEGAAVVPLRRIPDERGTIMHMLRRDDEHFVEFGEIYFTTIYEGVVKGWHRHVEMTLNYACPYGRVKLVLYDDREGSPTRGTLVEVFLSPDNHSLAVIPPEVWNGVKGMSAPFALLANCCTHAHDPSRTTRLDPHGGEIPYDWSRADF